VRAVAVVLDRVDLPEPFHREIRLERQQLVHVRLCFLAPSEMAERGDQRLVAVDEGRIVLGRAAADGDRFFVVAGERVRNHFNQLWPRVISAERHEITIVLELLQGGAGLAGIAMCQRTPLPCRRQARIDSLRSIEIIERGVIVFVEK
jgi:hypothetical protein